MLWLADDLQRPLPEQGGPVRGPEGKGRLTLLRLVLSLLATGACGSACGGPQPRQPLLHRPALDPVVLEKVEGGYLDVSELRGQPVVLFFFATHSGPAQAIAPFVAQVARRHAGFGLTVVGVAVESSGRAVVEAWRDYMEPPYAVTIADHDVIEGRSPLGSIPAIPSFAFLDRDGALVGWDVRLLDEEALDSIARDLIGQ